MNNWCLVLYLSVVLSYAEAEKIPNWLRPCSRTDPDFNRCALDSANYAVPLLIDGDRKLGLPSFKPFRISEVDLLGHETLKLKLNDIKVYGLEEIKPLDIKADFTTRTVSVKTFAPKIDILANYEIDGRILFLPLKGTGPCTITLVKGTYDYKFHFDVETRNGIEYAKINDALSTYDYDVTNIKFNLENLFKGDKQLGDETNKLLNESWKELNVELKESIIQTLLTVYSELAKKIYQKIPFNELLLP